MRGLAICVATGAVIGLGYWAYHQNIETKAAIREVELLQRQIGAERERLEVLQDEWAYLTRPDRLRDLVDLDFERLALLPMSPGQFAEAHEVSYRPSPEDILAQEQADLLLGSASESRP